VLGTDQRPSGLRLRLGLGRGRARVRHHLGTDQNEGRVVVDVALGHSPPAIAPVGAPLELPCPQGFLLGVPEGMRRDLDRSAVGFQYGTSPQNHTPAGCGRPAVRTSEVARAPLAPLLLVPADRALERAPRAAVD